MFYTQHIHSIMGSIRASVHFQKMSSRCSVNNILNAQMYLKVRRCLRQGAWGTLSAIKHTLWGSNAPALLCPALLLILVSSHGPRTSWIKKQKEPRAELRQEGSGLRCRWAQLEPPPLLSMQFCETLHDQVLNSAVWTHIWLPQHRCYSQPEEIWARGWGGGDITEQFLNERVWNFRIAWKLHVHCLRNVKRV